MKDAGVEVSSFISEELRANLYSQEVRALFHAVCGARPTLAVFGGHLQQLCTGRCDLD